MATPSWPDRFLKALSKYGTITGAAKATKAGRTIVVRGDGPRCEARAMANLTTRDLGDGRVVLVRSRLEALGRRPSTAA